VSFATPASRRLALTAVAAFPLLVACSDVDSTAPGPLPPSLPSSFRVRGEASGTDAYGGTADCYFFIIIELEGEPRQTPTGVEYLGRMGGEAGRTVLAPDGSGFAFFADVFWPDVKARLHSPDSIELVIGPEDPNEPSRFWRNFQILSGTRSQQSAGSGPWICAPFDIYEGGYVDTVTIAEGTWHIEL